MKSGIRAMDISGKRVITAKPNNTVISASKKMKKHRIGGLPVVRKGELVGILTERDIINKICAKGKSIKKIKVKDVMTTPVDVYAEIHEDLTTIAKKMVKNDVSRIPVVENGKLRGLITNKDIARESPPLINVLLEQLRINNPEFRFDPNSFGKCEVCGEPGQLDYKKKKFLCELCAKDSSLRN